MCVEGRIKYRQFIVSFIFDGFVKLLGYLLKVKKYIIVLFSKIVSFFFLNFIIQN